MATKVKIPKPTSAVAEAKVTDSFELKKGATDKFRCPRCHTTIPAKTGDGKGGLVWVCKGCGRRYR